MFWVDVNSESIAETGFVSAAVAFESSAESIDKVHQLFANTKHSWLLILDSADDPEVDYQKYLPSGSRGVVIMTSRVSDSSQYNTIGSEQLTSLDIGLSKQLLLQAANITKNLWPIVERQAEDIAKLIGSHTLALIHAGTYVAEGSGRLHEYSDVYSKHRKQILTYRPSQAQSRYGDVYATFEASAHVLEGSFREDSKDALHLLRIFSMLHLNALPLQMFETSWKRSRYSLNVSDAKADIEKLCRWHSLKCPEFMRLEASDWDPHRLDRAIDLLVSLSFVERINIDEGSSHLSIHPLAHAWAKDRQELGQQNQSWIESACIVALSIDDGDEHSVILPHLQSLLNNMEVKTASSLGPKLMVVSIFFKFASNLICNLDNSRVNDLLQDILATFAIKWDEASMEYLPIYQLYVSNLGYIGDIKTSLELQKQIVRLQQGVLPIVHPWRLNSQHELARAYHSNGELDKAIYLMEHVVKNQERVLPIAHLSRLKSQHELARAYLSNGQVAKSVELLEHVVKIQKLVLPVTHHYQLMSQHVLAHACINNGQVEKAILLLEQAVKAQQKDLPVSDPKLLRSQQELARVYHSNGQVDNAIDLMEHVVKIKEKSLSATCPRLLESKSELSRFRMEAINIWLEEMSQGMLPDRMRYLFDSPK